MGKKWLWPTVVAVALVFVIGWVVAQEERPVPYLPQKYSESYAPTLAEWHAIKLMAQLNTGSRYLSGPLVVEWCVVANPLQHPEELFLWVDMGFQRTGGVFFGGRHGQPERLEPPWQEGELSRLYEALGGKETMCEEAAAKVMETVRIYFPEIADKDVKIYFTMLGKALGTWQGGKTTLAAEE